MRVILEKNRLASFKAHFGKGVIAGGLFFAHALLHGLAISILKVLELVGIYRPKYRATAQIWSKP